MALALYGLFFIAGVVGALVLPTFSYFLAKEIGVRPLLVGGAFAGIALTSIAYNHFIGGWSDKQLDRRPIVIVCSLIGVIACVVLALSRNYWIVSLVAIGLLSLSMVAFSQILAYSLDYANQHIAPERIPLFNAVMRAQIAFAWVIGPPVGFWLATEWSFTVSYTTAAALYIVVAVGAWACLPLLSPVAQPLKEAGDALHTDAPSIKRSTLFYCAVGFSLMWGVNNAYLISLPIHLTDNLSIAPYWMGWLMGTTAALEVPFMLLAGFYAARFALMPFVHMAATAALVLYVGIYFVDVLWQLFVLQLFNAIFIGVLAGLGMSVVQSLMPNQSGAASSLYTNTTHVGNLLSSLMVALVADMAGYHAVFVVNVIIVIIAILAFSRVSLPATAVR
jgi:SET family sugar efflux transporter-like MFS transporter